jgi:hypothetical protein
MINSDTVAREQRIDSYDLFFVKEHMEAEGLLRGEDFAKIEHEFKRFLKLILSESGPLAVIDPRVDQLWHSFILFTSQYEKFCNDVVGFFVHHQPRTSRTPVAESAVLNFVDAYKRRFGELDLFWTERIKAQFREQISLRIVPNSAEFRWSGWTGSPNHIDRQHEDLSS